MECKGACNPETSLAIRVLLRLHQPQCIFLIEKKGNNARMRRLACTRGFNGCEARGLAGGLTMMWTGEVVLECLWATKRMICCSVKIEDSGT